MQLAKVKLGSGIKTNFMARSFMWAAIAFAAVFAIGFGTTQIVDASGFIRGINRDGFGSLAVYDTPASASAAALEAYNNLQTLNTIGIILTVISFVTTMVWMFKIMTASKMFIFIAYGTYIFSQGIGFSTLFLSFDVQELVYIFAIAGGLFGIMALAGMVFNLQKLGHFLFVGMIAVMIMSIFSIFFFDQMYMIMTIVTSLLFLGYTAFDVWMIRRTQQWVSMAGGMDPQIEFRLVAFFSFKLLSDIIGLIWMIARIVARNRN